MGRARLVLVAVATASLVAACSSDSGGSSAGGATPTSEARDSIPERTTTTAAERTTTTAAPTTAVVSTTIAPAPPVTPAPSVLAAPQAVAPTTTAPRPSCAAAPDPPAGVSGLQGMVGDVDGDGGADAIWVYDTAEGTHLHVRTARNTGDDIVVGYGSGAIAVGTTQVDLAVGTEQEGRKDEILVVTNDGDSRRLVGVYDFSLNTSCIQSFAFNSGNPFVYLVSRGPLRSGLRCVNDGSRGYLEAVTATPTTDTTFTTNRLVFGRMLQKLVPTTFVPGTLTLPTDEAALAADSSIVGCTLSAPAF